MSSNLVKMDFKKFVVFILSHGRPHLRDTYDLLRSCGYTGRIIVVCDNEDPTLDDYRKEYGDNNIYVFDKLAASKRMDAMNNFGKRNAILFARNICFDIAKEMGYDYFQELDDDYYYFGHHRKDRAKKTCSYNLIIRWFVEFLLNTNENVKSIAFSQGGDHIGGYNEDVIYKRKAMNSFICLTNRPFTFVGILNEDVNTYVGLGSKGDIFLTYLPFQLDQADTQKNAGGITELYKDVGTYVKSFYTVMIAPSCVSISQMGSNARRLHHRIKWENAVPCIISEDYKKQSK